MRGVVLLFAALAVHAGVVDVSRPRLPGVHIDLEGTSADTEEGASNSSVSVEECHASSRRRPHIVLLVFDDLGNNDLGGYSEGSPMTPVTPFMDSLMADGIKLRNHYVQPLCSPTRGAFMTGRYPIRWGGTVGVAGSAQRHWTPEEETYFPERLRSEAGYATKGTGKWHCGFSKVRHTPVGRGFDEWHGIYEGAGDHYNHRIEGLHNLWHDTAAAAGTAAAGFASHRRVHEYDGVHSTERITQEALRMIQQHGAGGSGQQRQPLFLYLPYQAPHLPNQVEQHWQDLNPHIPQNSQRRIFAGMVTHMDDAVRRVVDGLRDNGLWEDTVLIAFSDNGGNVPQGGSNWPLRGSKQTVWEGGTKSAGFLYARSSDWIPEALRGTSSYALSHAVDIHPTILGLAGITDHHTASPPSRAGGASFLPLDGVDMWPSWVGMSTAPARTEMLYGIQPSGAGPGMTVPSFLANEKLLKLTNGNRPDEVGAIRVGDWKLVKGFPGRGDWYSPDPSPCFTAEKGWSSHLMHLPVKDPTDYSLSGATGPGAGGADTGACVEPGDGGQKEIWEGKVRSKDEMKQLWLFNVVEDPEERNDLSLTMPDKVAELVARLQVYRDSAVPPQGPPTPEDIVKCFGGPTEPGGGPGKFSGFDVWNDDVYQHDQYRALAPSDVPGHHSKL